MTTPLRLSNTISFYYYLTVISSDNETAQSTAKFHKQTSRIDKYHTKVDGKYKIGFDSAKEIKKANKTMHEVLDAEEACEYLKIARVTLYKHVRSGQIPATKLGRIWRFQKSALEKWMSERIHDDTNERAANGRRNRERS